MTKKNMYSNSVNLFFKRKNEIINRYILKGPPLFSLPRAPTPLHPTLESMKAYDSYDNYYIILI